MRFSTFGACVLVLLSARPGRAQTGSEANLALSILAGTVLGHSLWSVDKQPLLCELSSCNGQVDTLQLSRSLTSSFILGAAASYFPSPHFGLRAELSYVGMPQDSHCTGLLFNPDDTHRNERICDDITAQAPGGGSIAMMIGLIARAAARRAFSPYLHADLGLVNLSRSTIEVEGAYVSGSDLIVKTIVLDEDPRRNSVLLGLGAGFTTPLGTGYQLRLEVRDVMTTLDRLTGPADPLGIAPSEGRMFHHVAIVFGLDVVLEKKRGRRY